MHIEESSPERLHVIMPSRFEELDQIVDLSESFVGQHVTDEEFVYKIVLLATEAVTNAIEHGNALDESKSVKMEMAVQASVLLVSVEDEGPGFDLKSVKDPLQEENLLAEGGRGLFLIDEMADRVTYEHGGRRIVMSFDMPS